MIKVPTPGSGVEEVLGSGKIKVRLESKEASITTFARVRIIKRHGDRAEVRPSRSKPTPLDNL